VTSGHPTVTSGHPTTSGHEIRRDVALLSPPLAPGMSVQDTLQVRPCKLDVRHPCLPTVLDRHTRSKPLRGRTDFVASRSHDLRAMIKPSAYSESNIGTATKQEGLPSDQHWDTQQVVWAGRSAQDCVRQGCRTQAYMDVLAAGPG